MIISLKTDKRKMEKDFKKLAIHMYGDKSIKKIADYFGKPLTPENCEFYYYLPDIDRVMPLLELSMWHPEYDSITSLDFCEMLESNTKH